LYKIISFRGPASSDTSSQQLSIQLNYIKAFNQRCSTDAYTGNDPKIILSESNTNNHLIETLSEIHDAFEKKDFGPYARRLQSLHDLAEPLCWTYSELDTLSNTFFRKALLPPTTKIPTSDSLDPIKDVAHDYQTRLDQTTQKKNLNTIHAALFPDTHTAEPSTSGQWLDIAGKLLGLQVNPQILTVMEPLSQTR
jgi:hypothetical protein